MITLYKRWQKGIPTSYKLRSGEHVEGRVEQGFIVVQIPTPFAAGFRAQYRFRIGNPLPSSAIKAGPRKIEAAKSAPSGLENKPAKPVKRKKATRRKVVKSDD